MSGVRALLADGAVLVAFAAGGRSNHGESGAVGATLVVAAPFLLGWLAGAAAARLDRAPASPALALRAWAVGIPLALALRRLVFDRGIAGGFVVVALVFTLLTLVGWRLAGGVWRRHREGASQPR